MTFYSYRYVPAIAFGAVSGTESRAHSTSSRNLQSRWRGQSYTCVTSNVPWLKWEPGIPPAFIPTTPVPPVSLSGPTLYSVTHMRYTENLAVTRDSLLLTPYPVWLQILQHTPYSPAELLTDSSSPSFKKLLLQGSLFGVFLERIRCSFSAAIAINKPLLKIIGYNYLKSENLAYFSL